LFQRLREAKETLDPWQRDRLAKALESFEAATGLDPGLTPLLVLRISRCPPPTARSLRKSVDEVLAWR
jgi:hypothetical protein